MAVYKGCVVSKRDLLGQGQLTVCPHGSDPDDQSMWIGVKYVSFYGGGLYAGAGFVPEVNQEILYDFVINDETNSYYYLGSVMDPSFDKIQADAMYPQDKDPKTGSNQTLSWDEEDGVENAQSMSYGWTTPLGHHVLSRENRDTDNSRSAMSVRSGQGHGLLLNDVPHEEGALLYSSGQKSKIRLTDTDSDDVMVGPEGISIDAGGNISLHSAEGNISIDIQDGNNIVIQNK